MANSDNPYSTPVSTIAPPLQKDESLEKLASAQRLTMYAIIGLLLSILLSIIVSFFWLNDTVASLFGLAAGIFVIVAAVKLSRALGVGWIATMLCVVALLLPLLGLLVLAALSSQATRKLKAGGYRIGFFGAKNEPPHA